MTPSSRLLRICSQEISALDGFFEWLNPDGEQYGTRRLHDFLAANHHLEPNEFIKALRKDVLDFSRGTEQADDLTAVVVKRNPDSSRGNTQ